MDDIKLSVEKAEILTRALPYIRDFRGKIMVVKFGRSVLKNPDIVKKVIDDVVLLKLIGVKVIIVHSGSDEINRWLKNIGKEIEFVDDNRVTDSETMEIIEMVLGKINKDIVQSLSKRGTNAVGICGKDSGTIIVHKKEIKDADIGFFGEITSINTELICDLLDRDFTPVIATIGVSDEYEAYNLKADEVACEVAKALKAEKVIFLSQEEGIKMSDMASFMSIKEAKEAAKSVNSAFALKLGYAIDAVENGVHRAHILEGSVEHCILLELFTIYGVGTAITSDNDELYPHERRIRGGKNA